MICFFILGSIYFIINYDFAVKWTPASFNTIDQNNTKST